MRDNYITMNKDGVRNKHSVNEYLEMRRFHGMGPVDNVGSDRVAVLLKEGDVKRDNEENNELTEVFGSRKILRENSLKKLLVYEVITRITMQWQWEVVYKVKNSLGRVIFVGDEFFLGEMGGENIKISKDWYHDIIFVCIPAFVLSKWKAQTLGDALLKKIKVASTDIVVWMLGKHNSCKIFTKYGRLSNGWGMTNVAYDS